MKSKGRVIKFVFFEILCTWKEHFFYKRAVSPGVNKFVLLAYWFMTSNIKIELLRRVILFAALYGCKILSFTYTERCMFRIVENVAIEEYFEHRKRN
jgi:hypothetical protein